MYKKLPIDPRYSFHLDGSYIFEGKTFRPKGKNVKIDVVGRVKELSVEWLALLSHYEVDTKHINVNRVVFYRCDNRVIGLKCKNFMFYDLQLKYKDGFYHIPGFSGFAIARDGRVMSIKTGRILSEAIGPYGYPYVNIYDPDKSRWRSVATHLLLARTFIKNAMPEVTCFVNHKDGNKLNYKLTNLEWVSSRDNQKHAIANGLRNDNMPCIVEDLISKEIREFVSKAEARKALGFSGDLVYRSILAKNGNATLGVLVSSRYKITPVGCDRDWDAKVDRKDKGPYQAKNAKTGEVVEADYMKALARKIGVSEAIVRTGVYDNSRCIRLGWMCRKKTDAPWPTKASVACSNKKQAIVAVSVETGEESIFASKRDLTRQIGIDKRTLANRLRSGKLYGSFWFKVHSPPQQ